MNRNILFSATVIAALSMGSCSKDSTTATPGTGNGGTNNGGGNNAPASMVYELKGINAFTNVAHKGAAVASIQWSTAIANPTLIKFEAKQNGTEIEYKSNNTAQIDLLSSIATSFGTFTLPVGTYSEVELKIQLSKNGSNPALKLTGSYTDSNSIVTPIEFRVDNSIEIKTETSNVAITTGSFQSVTTLDLSSFTAGITQSMVSSGQLTGGVLVISASSNVSLYNIILNNLSNRHHSEIGHH